MISTAHYKSGCLANILTIERKIVEFFFIRLFDACSKYHHFHLSFAFAGFFEGKLVGDIVLVDIAYILHRFPADSFGCNDLDVLKPDVRIKAILSRFFA